MTLSACHDDDIPNNPPKPTVSSTVLVYFIAENNLSYPYDYYYQNVVDMKKGMKDCPNGATWLVYMDKGAAPTLSRFIKDRLGVVTEEVVKRYPDQYSTDPNVMKKVLQDAYSLYPADSLGLILSSHASGSMYSPFSYAELNGRVNNPAPPPSKRAFGSESQERPGVGVGYDENYYTMNITDLATAFAGLPKRLQYVMFDACLMGNIESAYELKDYARYFLASPNSTPGVGYPYAKVVKPLANMSVFDLSSVVNTFVEGYSTNSVAWDDFAATTLLDLNEIDNLAAKLSDLLADEVAQGKLEQLNRVKMQLYEAETEDEEEYPYFPLYDLGLFVDSISNPQQPQIAESVHAALRRLVVRFAHQNYFTVIIDTEELIFPYVTGRFCGTTIYIPPKEAYNLQEYLMLHFYKDLKWFTAAGFDQSSRYKAPLY